MAFCSRCGTQISDSAAFCEKCGAAVGSIVVQEVPLSENAGIRMLLPIGRSGWAIAAGYVALFSLIPIFLIGLIALALGIVALVDIKKHPQRHGLGRAWFAIILGGLTSTIWGVLTISTIFA